MNSEVAFVSSVIRFLEDDCPETIISSGNISDINIGSIKNIENSLDTNEDLSEYNTLSETFYHWLRHSKTKDWLEPVSAYLETDSNMSRTRKTLNQIVSYLESKSVSAETLSSFYVAWNQYMRECRL